MLKSKHLVLDPGAPSLMLTVLLLLILFSSVAYLWLPLLSDLAAVVGAPTQKSGALEPHTRFLFLIPAHNEALLISDTVRSLHELNYPEALRRIVVIADNCDDDTATIARAAGAECLERTDASQLGKPHALAWALRQIAADTYDSCVIIDADTMIDRGAASALAAHSPLASKAVQSYIAVSNEGETWLTRLGGVLSAVRYERSYVRKDLAGLNCPLTGNGMAIGADLLRENGWEAFTLTENWDLYGRYTARGVRIEYARLAIVRAQEPRSMGQGTTQRRRWMAGRFMAFRKWGAAILRCRSISLHQKVDALAELGGLSPVLSGVFAGAIAIAALLLPVPGGTFIAGAAVLSLSGLAVDTLHIIFGRPRPWRTLLAFSMLPAYAVWRAGVALLTILTVRDQGWRKTERHRATSG